MVLALFGIALLLAAIDARTFIVSQRGPYAVQYGIVRTAIGFIAMLATFALIIWGFMHLPWWWALIALVVAVIVQTVAVTRLTLGPLIVISPAFQIAVIALTVWLWFFS